MTADADDVLTIGGELSYAPLAWLLALAEESTQSSQTSSPLAETFRCDLVAETIQSASSESAVSDCDSACLESLCQGALDSFWEELKQADSEPQVLELAASGQAQVDGPSCHHRCRVCARSKSW